MEITHYKEKIQGIFTVRQALSIAIMVVIVGAVMFYVRPYVPTFIAPMIAILPGAPVLIIGFVSYQGMLAEQFAKFISRFAFKFNKDIGYETDEEHQAKVYYYSHIPGFMKLRSSFSKKTKSRIDEYFMKTRPELMKQLREGNAPLKIRPSKLTKKELARIEKEERRHKAEVERRRKEQIIIKERTDRARDEIESRHMKPVSERKKTHKKKNVTNSVFRKVA